MSLFMSDDVVLKNSEVLLDTIQAWDSELTIRIMGHVRKEWYKTKFLSLDN